MFSSTTNPFCPCIIDHHEINGDIFLHQNQPTIPLLPVTETSTTSLSLLNNDQQQQQLANCVFFPEKKKKDRHSKIYTAQGLRDRRVRLSIEIARKFFHLQDMLGFDKASKTLEWLLTKSKKAIKEVEQNARSSASTIQEDTLDSPSQENGEQVDKVKEQIAEDGESGIGTVSSSTIIINNKKKNTKKLQKCVVGKESRAKARARARERTRIKMSSRNFNDSCFTQILMNHYGNPKLVEQPNFNTNIVPKENNIVEESIVIKRKLKSYPIMGYQQNLVMLKDFTCNSNNNNNLLPNLPQTWEINSAIARSSFCAITNMNRSTGLHHCGKLWEAENSSNQCLL